MNTFWGEFRTQEIPNEQIIPAETVKNFIINAMQQEPFRIPLPASSTNQDQINGLDLMSLETVGLEVDNRVIHTIKLLKHSRQMSQLIEAAKEQTELMADTQINTFPPALDIPDYPGENSVYKLNYPIQYMDKEYSEFSLGKGSLVPEITTATAKQLLKKSVAALLAHAGYQMTKESVLNTLSDVAEDYIEKITCLLRVVVDQGANSMVTGFPDAMERVFHQMNIGSMICLHDYYQSRVIKYHEKILEECKALNWEYNNISIPIKTETLSLDTITKIEEPDDVPEIHFPALGEGDGVDELQPSLEPGFQMLHSLEQEANLQNVDSQEDETVHMTDSPIQEITPDALQTHFLSKRRKRM